MRTTFLTLYIIFSCTFSYSQTKKAIIRIDDIGMCHGVNMGAQKIFETGMPINASVITISPWFAEAASIIKKYKNVTVGLHIALNSEWKNFKWRPLSGSSQVPSLVDNNGYFRYQNAWFWKDTMNMAEVEKEVRAQIEAVKKAGLKLTYLDAHMGCLNQNEQSTNLLIRLAKEYNLGLSGYYGEIGSGIKETTDEDALTNMLLELKKYKQNELRLIVSHPGSRTEEMEALVIDGPDSDNKSIAQGRAAVVHTLCSEDFRKELENQNIVLTDYSQLVGNKGFNSMVFPNKK